MPLYEYQCEVCGHRVEVIQKFSDAPPEQCPKCGGAVRKLQAAPAFQLKGTGWYVTDYAKKDQAAEKDRAAGNESSGSSDGAGGDKGAAPGDTSKTTEKAGKAATTTISTLAINSVSRIAICLVFNGLRFFASRIC